MTFCNNKKTNLAAREGDRVTILDARQLIGQPAVAPVTADKSNVKPLSRNSVRFELVHLVFNSPNENYLAVAGYEESHLQMRTSFCAELEHESNQTP